MARSLISARYRAHMQVSNPSQANLFLVLPSGAECRGGGGNLTDTRISTDAWSPACAPWRLLPPAPQHPTLPILGASPPPAKYKQTMGV